MESELKEQGFGDYNNVWKGVALEIKTRQDELRKIKPDHNLISLVVVGNIERGEISPSKEFENNYLVHQKSNIEGYQKYIDNLKEAIKN